MGAKKRVRRQLVDVGLLAKKNPLNCDFDEAGCRLAEMLGCHVHDGMLKGKYVSTKNHLPKFVFNVKLTVVGDQFYIAFEEKI